MSELKSGLVFVFQLVFQQVFESVLVSELERVYLLGLVKVSLLE